jgi:voltage-gated potassium channel Kch
MDDDRLSMAEGAGYLFVKGSATEEETLIRAGAERAQVLAPVLPLDTVNVFLAIQRAPMEISFEAAFSRNYSAKATR